MRVLFLTGGTEEPATRFRVSALLPHLQARGIEYTHISAYGPLYKRLLGSRLHHPYRLAARLKRAAATVALAGRHDVIFLQRTALPWIALPEVIASLRNPRIVFDYDDSIFLNEDGSPAPMRQRAFLRAIAASARVIAGNGFLAAGSGAPAKTEVIPTVVDTDRWCPPPPETGEPAGSGEPDPEVVIGWIGTPGHFDYFPEVMPAILRVLEEHPRAKLRLVCNLPYTPLVGHPRVDQRVWSEAGEVAEVQRFDIGIMPMPDTAWTRGKCALKMIQYMASGRPVVVSPVGANVEVFGAGDCGFLARTPDDWVAALRRLVTDAELRRRMGAAGRARAVAHYSVQAVLPRYVELLQGLAAQRRPTSDARAGVLPESELA